MIHIFLATVETFICIVYSRSFLGVFYNQPGRILSSFWVGKHQTSLATLLAPLTPDRVFGLPLMQMVGKGGRAQKRGSAGLSGFQASPLTGLAPPPAATWRLHWREWWAVI